MYAYLVYAPDSPTFKFGISRQPNAQRLISYRNTYGAFGSCVVPCDNPQEVEDALKERFRDVRLPHFSGAPSELVPRGPDDANLVEAFRIMCATMTLSRRVAYIVPDLGDAPAGERQRPRYEEQRSEAEVEADPIDFESASEWSMANLFLRLLQPERLVFVGSKYGSWRLVSGEEGIEKAIRRLLPEQLSALVATKLSGHLAPLKERAAASGSSCLPEIDDALARAVSIKNREDIMKNLVGLCAENDPERWILDNEAPSPPDPYSDFPQFIEDNFERIDRARLRGKAKSCVKLSLVVTKYNNEKRPEPKLQEDVAKKLLFGIGLWDPDNPRVSQKINNCCNMLLLIPRSTSSL